MDYIGILQCNVASKITYPKLTNDVQLQSFSVGSLFKLNDKPYLLTCHHCVKDTLNHELIIEKKKYKCGIAYVSDELELALLNINADVKDVNYIKDIKDITENLSMGINNINPELIVQTVNISKYIDKNKFSILQIKCLYNEVTFQTLESINMPSMPFITVRLKDKFNDNFIIDGISGSLVIDGSGNGNDSRILGIVSNITNSIIQIIPNAIINRFLKEIKENNEFNGLCTLVGKFTTCNFNNDAREQINGIFVDDAYNINYNNYNYKEKKNEKGMNLKNGDIILNIEGKPIDERGHIYDNNLQLSIYFTTFIALNYLCGMLIQLKVMRRTKIRENDNDYKEKTILIKARPLHSMKYIQNVFNGKTFTYNGLVFGEISEDIINNYIKVGIYIGNSLQEYYLKNPYRNEDERVVVLLDINRKQMKGEITNAIDHLKLPLINTINKNYSIPIVSKVNKKKITSLNDMIDILKKQSNGVIYLAAYKMNEIKAIIKNNVIAGIQ